LSDPSPAHNQAFAARYPALPGSVAEIRTAVGNWAATAGAAPERVADMRLAVSEAASNVVAHAYGEDDPGELTVAASADLGVLSVVVEDTGSGLERASARPGLGAGLTVIARLADRVELTQRAGDGLRVSMSFGRV
jgi:anti-sigma regulatory factor (Ser/Thr protein kinase)